MEVELNQISKRFASEWIFKDINFKFQSGQNYAIKGANGSGKSTLLKLISSNLSPSKGNITHSLNGSKLDRHQIYQHFAYAAPYVDLIEEFKLAEAIEFHQKFKPFKKGVSTSQILDRLGFKRTKSKYINSFSSGMKQRVKLILAICSDVPLLILDEPTTNLDQQGKNWYMELLQEYSQQNTVIIASNEAEDFINCVDTLIVEHFKPK